MLMGALYTCQVHPSRGLLATSPLQTGFNAITSSLNQAATQIALLLPKLSKPKQAVLLKVNTALASVQSRSVVCCLWSSRQREHATEPAGSPVGASAAGRSDAVLHTAHRQLIFLQPDLPNSRSVTNYAKQDGVVGKATIVTGEGGSPAPAPAPTPATSRRLRA